MSHLLIAPLASDDTNMTLMATNASINMVDLRRKVRIQRKCLMAVGRYILARRLRPLCASCLILAVASASLDALRPAFGQSSNPATPVSVGGVRELAIQRARGHIRYGLNLAERGAVYSAQTEFVQALRLIATDLDLATGTHDHAAAIEAGLQALNSADIVGRNGSSSEAPTLAEARPGAAWSSSVSAMQRQLLDAQERLVFGAGHQPTASMALYLLGQSQMAAAGETAEDKALAGPKTIALYQAALAVDPTNYFAANELGALFAKYGQLDEAQRVLAHGVAVAPQPAMWHNLVVVYERMGDTVAAQQAQSQYDALVAARRSSGGNPDASPVGGVAAKIRWTDAADFVRCSASDDLGPPVQHETAAADNMVATEKHVAPKPAPKRDAGLSLPNWMTSPLRTLGGMAAPSQEQ